MTRHFDHQGKRPEQVETSELLAGTCLAVLVILLVGRWLLTLGTP